MHVHEGFKNYECYKCDKNFSHKDTLKKHIGVVHEGISNYKCHICTKTCSQLIHLQMHMRFAHENSLLLHEHIQQDFMKIAGR